MAPPNDLSADLIQPVGNTEYGYFNKAVIEENLDGVFSTMSQWEIFRGSLYDLS
jgi:hypothetical protein